MLDKPRAVEVFAWTGTLVHQTPLEDTAVMLIRFDGGKMAQIEVNWITRHEKDDWNYPGRGLCRQNRRGGWRS